MKLGDLVQIGIGVPDVAESVHFYETLGFEKLGQGEHPHPWAQFTDGQNLLLLNQDGEIYIGLQYFSPDATKRMALVEAAGVAFLQKREVDGRLSTAIFADENGLMVALVNQDPTGMPVPDGVPLSHCGKFGEFALGVTDFQTASAFWQQFGFEQLYASGDPYPWGIHNDGLITLGLHQTEAFQGPCMTYFAVDMPARIERLQAAGLTIDDGVLKAPGGETLFLFEGEV